MLEWDLVGTSVVACLNSGFHTLLLQCMTNTGELALAWNNHHNAFTVCSSTRFLVFTDKEKTCQWKIQLCGMSHGLHSRNGKGWTWRMWQNPDVETALVENTLTQTYRHLLSLIIMPYREKHFTERLRRTKYEDIEDRWGSVWLETYKCDPRHLYSATLSLMPTTW